MRQPTRRHLLATTAAVGALSATPRPSGARVISGALPWSPNEVYPAPIARPGPWQVLSAEEAAVVEAITFSSSMEFLLRVADRLEDMEVVFGSERPCCTDQRA